VSLSLLQAKSAFAQHFSKASHFSGIVNNMMHIKPICESGHLLCLEICHRQSAFEIAVPAKQGAPHY
jgi:hypothetical protein